MPVQNLLEKYILKLFENQDIRITPQNLERTMGQKCKGTQRAEIRAVIKKMVRSGVLCYSGHHATSYLEINRSVPQWITERIVICRFDGASSTNDETICVKLVSSAAFGGGEHPTTQMCLRGIEVAMARYIAQFQSSPRTALDLGTGTGVLAIATSLLGVRNVVAVDVDPFARFEAQMNVAANGLTPEQVQVTEATLTQFHPLQFDLLLANLRPPTLKRLYPEMLNMTSRNGIWVISGYRPQEIEWLYPVYKNAVAEIFWKDVRKNWGALAIQWRTQESAKAHPRRM